jgi:hypothetical protein
MEELMKEQNRGIITRREFFQKSVILAGGVTVAATLADRRFHRRLCGAGRFE